MLTGTVVVCTRDRRQVLLQCLASLDQQLLDAPLDVLVVDDGSRDGTADALDRWAAATTGRRVLRQEGAGLSAARNAGLRAAAGDVVLFCDDDALAPPGWAQAHLRAHERPGVVAVGGPVHLAFPDGCPSWVTPALHHWWSALEGDEEPGPFPPPHGPYGTNLSVGRAATLAVGGFPTWLGRRGRSLLSSEEAELSRRLEEAGGVLWWEPAAPVQHQIGAGRLTRQWLLRRGAAQGRSNARRQALGAGPTPDPVDQRRQAAVQLREAARIGRALVRPPAGAGAARPAPPDRRLDDLGRLAGHAAAGVEHLRLAVAGRLGTTGPVTPPAAPSEAPAATSSAASRRAAEGTIPVGAPAAAPPAPAPTAETG